jgi:NAD(P)-dependent dehydrogenase (short-subunit alcohol dehydrogenase family)
MRRARGLAIGVELIYTGRLPTTRRGGDVGARLAGKVAVVTGAGSGIGRASAKLFAAEGAKVLIADVTDGVEETARAITAAGGTAIAVKADAGNEAAVQGLVERALGSLGGLHVFYANAGISGGYVPLDQISVEHFQEILRVNLLGPFLAIKHASPIMVKQGGGSIVLTASVAGLKANAGGLPYSASKAGVISLAQTSANLLRATGVRVNAICPGLIETGMTKPIFEMARARGNGDRLGQLSSLGRYGEPEEIAAMALFLASDDASYVTGQAIAVDGGLTSTHPYIVQRRKE